MKFTSLVLLTASVVCLFACSQENNNTTAETATADDLTTVTSTPQSTTTSTQVPPAGQPEITTEPNQPANQPVAAGMNPPHGQPGHRCDIEVGAPLNSPAKNTPATSNTAPASNNAPLGSSATSPILSAPNPAPATAGINPPHGQPGHDCAVPVGAPL